MWLKILNLKSYHLATKASDSGQNNHIWPNTSVFKQGTSDLVHWFVNLVLRPISFIREIIAFCPATTDVLRGNSNRGSPIFNLVTDIGSVATDLWSGTNLIWLRINKLMHNISNFGTEAKDIRHKCMQVIMLSVLILFYLTKIIEVE
jgi:hypothetical protein